MKIVAIGGGILYTDIEAKWSCSFISSIFRIIELTNKSNPNILVLSHASSTDLIENMDSTIMADVFKNLGCNVKILFKKDLDEKNKSFDYVSWADAIFENGGCTSDMIKLWNNKGFSSLLINSNDKVLSGISAGANCWFSNYSGRNYNKDLYNGKGLSLIDAYFVPHSNERDRIIYANNHLIFNDKTGLFIPDNCSIEIVDDKYRIIYDSFGKEMFKLYAKYKYFEDESIITHNMNNEKNYKSLNRILRK